MTKLKTVAYLYNKNNYFMYDYTPKLQPDFRITIKKERNIILSFRM